MRIPFFSRSKQSAKIRQQTEPMCEKPSQPKDFAIIRHINERLFRSYEAALSNGMNADSQISISSANTEIYTSLWATRSRARSHDRDNPYVRGILDSYQNNVCGDDPFRLEMNVGKWQGGKFVKEVETNRAVEAAWKDAANPENCTVRRDMSRLELDIQALISIIRDGGYLARHIRAFPHNKYRYALQPREIDRLDHFWMGRNEQNGNLVKFSIELDEWEAPVAYWLKTKHPGEIYNISETQRSERERIDAKDIIAFFDLRLRGEQLIGISRLASIISRLHRIEQFDIAHTTAAIWSACKPLFLVQEMPAAMEYVPDQVKKLIDNQIESYLESGQKTKAVEPGEVEELPYGKKPFQVDPKFPIENAPEFIKSNLRAIAAGSGSAYFLVANDLEAVNFSSGRIGLDAFRDGCKMLQRHFVYMFRRPHFNEWLKSALLNGAIKLPFSRYEEFKLAAEFYGRRWPYLQPIQDAQADQLRLQMRTTSRDRIIAESERGGRYEQVAAELASDISSDEDHDLTPFDESCKGEGPRPGEELISESPDNKSGKKISADQDSQ